MATNAADRPRSVPEVAPPNGWRRLQGPGGPRLLSAAVLVLSTLVVAVLALGAAIGNLTIFMLALLLVIPWAILNAALQASVYGPAVARAAETLDEPELEQLERALRRVTIGRAARILLVLTLTLAGALVLLLAGDLPTWVAFAGGALGFFVLVGLPVHLRAWRPRPPGGSSPG